jgi:hypothetical protein
MHVYVREVREKKKGIHIPVINPAYRASISQLIRYDRACSLYSDYFTT